MPCILVLWYAHRYLDNALTKMLFERRQASADMAALVVKDRFDHLIELGRALASRVQFRKLMQAGKWQEAIQIMQEVPSDFPYIDRVFLADVSGTLMADAPPLPGAQEEGFALPDWYQGVSKDWQPYLSTAYRRAAPPHSPVAAAAVPIRSDDGILLGILGLQVRLDKLLEEMTGIEVGAAGLAYVIDRSGRAAVHPELADALQDLSAVPAVQQALLGKRGVLVAHDPIEREQCISAFAPVPPYGWAVVVKQPVEDAFALPQASLDHVLAGDTVVVLLCATLAAAIALVCRQMERSRNALAASEEKMRSIMESAPDALLLVDRQGMITWVNSQTEAMFGHPRAELLGKPVAMLIPARFREHHPGYCQAYCANPKPRPMGIGLELYGLRQNGTEFPVEISLSPLRAPEGLQVICVIRDVTLKRRAERKTHALNQALKRYAAQLEQANKELEAFAYSVSHDLRAPLRAIDGFSQALLEDYPDRLDDQGKDYLQRVRAASQRMAELIDDILQLSRISRTELRWERVDLSALAEAVAEELQRAEPDRRIELVIQPGLQIIGDPKLLRIALANLLANAWKFTSRQPVARIEVGRQDSGGEPVFFVRDNGVGFDMAYADKLFTPFQRLHGTDEFPGTGIGLATVQRILHRHGGRVWAEAAVGQGAVFYFTLPAAKLKEQP